MSAGKLKDFWCVFQRTRNHSFCQTFFHPRGKWGKESVSEENFLDFRRAKVKNTLAGSVEFLFKSERF
jgi:hypothetical protein